MYKAPTHHKWWLMCNVLLKLVVVGLMFDACILLKLNVNGLMMYFSEA
jgi:hypothetical protein